MKEFSSQKDLSHYPVMLDQVMQICEPEKGGYYVDCTFGTGGYSNAILSSPKTKVIALDRDSYSKKYAEKTKNNYRERFSFYNGKFGDLKKIVKNEEKFDFIIFDLGVSSLQIFNLNKGFSFNSKSEIDMNMGHNSISVKDVLNNFSLSTLNDIIKFLGEERESFRIAKNITNERKKKPILFTPDLVDIIKKSKKKDFNKKINISTKTFQALRIFVNQELSELIEGLISATELIKSGGKIIVISFHSLEDKIVKFFFTNYSKNRSKSSRYYPDVSKEKSLFESYKNKLIKPSLREIELNAPSRSAKLRFATRSQEDFFYPDEFKMRFKKYLDLEAKNV